MTDNQSIISKVVSQGGKVSIATMAKIIGCHPATVRTLAKSGKIPHTRLPSSNPQFSQFRFNVREVLAAMEGAENLTTEKEECEKILLYGRVSNGSAAKGYNSNTGEESNLSRQVALLQDYATTHYPSHQQVLFTDVASGMGVESRKGFSRLVNEILAHKHDGCTLIVKASDRLIRFMVELVEMILSAHSVKLVIVMEDEKEENAENEMADDILSVICHFSARHYGKRSSITNTKHLTLDCIARGKQLAESGVSMLRIAEILNNEGFVATNGKGESKITRSVLGNFLHNEATETLVEVEPEECSLDIFLREKTKRVSGERIKASFLYSVYVDFCNERGLTALPKAGRGHSHTRFIDGMQKAEIKRVKNDTHFFVDLALAN